jgi:L-ascorbate metabolism protein UlaG (beta-lactamase superfamily)
MRVASSSPQSKDLIIAIDPWLEGNPLCPGHFKNPEQLDLLILTHGHADHAGDALRLGLKTNAQLIATYELVNALVEDGYPQDKAIGMNTGGSLKWQGLTITLTPAFHSNSYNSRKRALPIYAGEPNGIIIKANNKTIYFAGDTALFGDLTLLKELYNPDIAFLPIGDHFTMGPKEAAYAGRLLQSELLIPIHHSTFPALTGTPADFQSACQELKLTSRVVTLAPGEHLEV